MAASVDTKKNTPFQQWVDATLPKKEGEAKHIEETLKFNRIATLMPDPSYEKKEKWQRVAAWASIVAYVVIAAVATILTGIFLPAALPVAIIVAGAGILLPIKIFKMMMGKANALKEKFGAEEKFVENKLKEWKQPPHNVILSNVLNVLTNESKVLESSSLEKLREKTCGGNLYNETLNKIHLAFGKLLSLDLESQLTGLDPAKRKKAADAVNKFKGVVEAQRQKVMEASKQKGEELTKEKIQKVIQALKEVTQPLEKALGELNSVHEWKEATLPQLLNIHSTMLIDMHVNLGASTSCIDKESMFANLEKLRLQKVDLQQFKPLLARVLFWYNKEKKTFDTVDELGKKLKNKQDELGIVSAELNQSSTQFSTKIAALTGKELSQLLEKRNTLKRQVAELSDLQSRLKYQLAQYRLNTALRLMVLRNPSLMFDVKDVVDSYLVPNPSDLKDKEEKLFRLVSGKGLSLDELTGDHKAGDLSDELQQAITYHMRAQEAVKEAEAKTKEAAASQPPADAR